MSRMLPRAAAVADRRVSGLSQEVLAELVAELTAVCRLPAGETLDHGRVVDGSA